MAKLYAERALTTPIDLSGAGGATITPPAVATLRVDRQAILYETDATETRGPYIAAWFRVTHAGANGTWVLPTTYGFRLLLTYTDNDTLELIMRAKSQGDNPWSGVILGPNPGSHWIECQLMDNTDTPPVKEVDFGLIVGNPSASSTPSTSSTAVERFTISSSKIPRDVEFFDDVAA